MMDQALLDWMQALGYDPDSLAVHQPMSRLRDSHSYAPELLDLLNPIGEIRANAVFDVEGVPTVCFFADDGSLLQNSDRLQQLRERIWNQNLISLILVYSSQHIIPVPPTRREQAAPALAREDAQADGPLSRSDIQSGDIWLRYKSWFRVEDRVDRTLLANLRETVKELSKSDPTNKEISLSRGDAQYLLAQILFVSYLEDRGIIGEKYRRSRNVGRLFDLVQTTDRHGIVQLLSRLKFDFNGDFLEPTAGSKTSWLHLSDRNFETVRSFLLATEMETGQLNAWPYNFRYIPVELLSGIYEAFLGPETKKEVAAYYTPRNLANLVVEQAFRESSDVLSEKIYDGACGSGILLTTAFRRIIVEAETRRSGAPLRLKDRIKLLKQHIFGSDVSEAACRVTAFSLYLSLLERLVPADISALCDNARVKLPKLRGTNLFGGAQRGQFFSSRNPLVKRGNFTLFLSNPPWIEPAGDEDSAADAWAEKEHAPRALRQLAADFAWRATQCLAPSGRLCLILPMSLLLKPTSQQFLSAWLEKVKLVRIINFGDLKELMFEDGRKACVVLIAKPRRHTDDELWAVPPSEHFEYWVPKADISLAFGRLTLHSSDRHSVQTQAISLSTRQLTTRMWGDDFDLALWAQLRLRGTFADLFTGQRKRWWRRKGFHKTDNSVERGEWVSTSALWDMPFVKPEDLYSVPVVDLSSKRAFPKDEITEVPHLGNDLLAVFDGPRILFPDGPSPTKEIRAAFTEEKGCFMSSVGVIAGPPTDTDLLRFATVYLRSDLVRYFVVTQLYQLLSDRDRISLSDISHFPFFLPERHPHPALAHQIVSEIANITREIETTNPLLRKHRWDESRQQAESKLLQYFGLSAKEGEIVRETVELVLPRIRPYGLAGVFDRAQLRASDQTIQAYVSTLLSELEAWRDARRGNGSFKIHALLTRKDRSGPFGLVRVTLGGRQAANDVSIARADEMVRSALKQLHNLSILPASFSDDIYFMPNSVIVSDNSIYLVKPQTERAWLMRQARRDAETIVSVTTRPSTSLKSVA
jgi:hypothetical protein